MLVACGSSSPDVSHVGMMPSPLIERRAENATAPEIVVGSKDFTEEYVLAEVYARALRAAGYHVRTHLDIGDERDAYEVLTSGVVSAYPEYLGTALTSLYGVSAERVPRTVRAAYARVRAHAAEDGIVALAPTPFSDSNGFAVRPQTASRHRLRSLSDLARAAPSLTLSGAPECARRLDCLKGLRAAYGASFKRFLPIDIADRYRTLASGRSDVTVAFTTDGQIKTDGLVLLRDDRHMLPPDNVTLLVRSAVARAAGPGLARVVALVQRGLTTATMQELNSRVDIDGQSPGAVAAEYLRENGYVRG
ncbi:MAG TPA: glycine betaine ABC transporter substrate-binding protein [Solirubrobacteraceae bacterium]|nr:glycine betaine ABC transporter substrate-binding protein [Solirubrobacteraceae bacterium]